MEGTRTVTKRLVIENTYGRSLTFILEPWADEYPMAAGQRFIVEGNGPSHGQFTVEQIDDMLIASAWDGSDARILREDGTVLDDWTGLRVPDFSRRDDMPSNRSAGGILRRSRRLSSIADGTEFC